MDAGHRAFVRAAASQKGECRAGASSGSAGGQDEQAGTGGRAAPVACSSGSAPAAGRDDLHGSRINMAPVPNEPGTSAQGQLSSARQASTIPMAQLQQPPQHQGDAAAAAGVWMYPSEQQFYNAMRRKGWNPQEADMQRVVAIHNGVNERAWQHVLAWEALHACERECGRPPQLKRFQGKPNEFSPKARLLNFLGYKLPFDRHDWIVDRCGREVRYIIDFYSGPPTAGAPASMHLDVRPALDSPGALLDRLRMQARWISSGRWAG